VTGAVTATGNVESNGGILRANRINDATPALLYLDADAGYSRDVQLRTGTSPRWALRANGTAEGGGNAGSNFNLIRFDDTGANLGNALSIVRSTGEITISNGLAASGDISTDAGHIFIDRDGDAEAAYLFIDGDSGQSKNVVFRTANATRWTVRSDGVAESGSNAGSNFDIARFDDSGVIIDTALTILRNTGEVQIENNLSVTGAITSESNSVLNDTALYGLENGGTTEDVNSTDSVTDADALTSNARLTLTTGEISNLPSGIGTRCVLEVYNYHVSDGVNVLQTCYNIDAAAVSMRIWQRVRITDVWGSWFEITDAAQINVDDTNLDYVASDLQTALEVGQFSSHLAGLRSDGQHRTATGDIDGYTSNGVWISTFDTGGTNNWPEDIGNYAYLEVRNRDDSIIQQRVYGHTNIGQHFARSTADGGSNWSAWQRVDMPGRLPGFAFDGTLITDTETDFDNHTTNCDYRFWYNGSTPTNGPADLVTSSALWLSVRAYSSSYIVQTLTDITYDRVWQRRYRSSAWTPWQEVSGADGWESRFFGVREMNLDGSIESGASAMGLVGLEQIAPSNQLDYVALDPTTDETVFFTWPVPDNFDESLNYGVYLKIYWSHTGATSYGIRMVGRVAGIADGSNLAATLSTATAVDDTGGTDGYLYITPALNIDTNNELQAGRLASFRVLRDADHANDTLDVDMRLHGIEVFWKTVDTKQGQPT
jgi:hypothetical protein